MLAEAGLAIDDHAILVRENAGGHGHGVESSQGGGVWVEDHRKRERGAFEERFRFGRFFVDVDCDDLETAVLVIRKAQSCRAGGVNDRTPPSTDSVV